MKKSELKQLIKEEISKLGSLTLKMYASYGDIGDKYYPYNPSFKEKGMINKDKFGANGTGWEQKEILCTHYLSDEDSWKGVDEGWEYNVIFEKSIYEIYLDDEFHNLEFKDKTKTFQQNENDFYNFLEENNWKNISLGTLKDKTGLIVKPNYPLGTYVLNVKPNEIIKVLKRD